MSASVMELKMPATQEKVYVQLKEIFATVLGTALEEIDTGISFVELGLDSLALSDASQRLHEIFGVQIPFRALLEQLPTIESVAARIIEELQQTRGPEAQEQKTSPASLAQTETIDESLHSPALEQAAPVGPLAETSEQKDPAPEPGGFERIVQRQLQIMSAQLDLLRQCSGRADSTVRKNSGEEHFMLPGASQAEIGTGRNGSYEAGAGAVAASTASSKPGKRELAGTASSETPGPVAVQPFVAFQPIQPGASTLKDPRQQTYLESLVQRVSSQTAESKRRSQQYREFMGDNRWSAGFRVLWKEMFYPIMSDRASGSHIWDVDGHEYIDLTMGFGSLFFGHTPPFVTTALHEQIDRGIGVGPQSALAGKVARLVCELTGMERVTFCNSGTEGIMTALRLARMATKRNKIVVFAGSYHGTFDGVLTRQVELPDGSMKAIPMAQGIDPDMVKNVVMLRYNSPESVEYIRKAGHELAAVLVEPVQSRRPDLETRDFLHGLRQATEETGSLLIFDEVITGFRMHLGGAQAMFDVRADLAVYGKALGAGLPIGAVAGKRAYIDAVDGGQWSYGDRSYPQADTTFVAGTFFKHPLAMAAAWAGLNYIKARGMQLYEELGQRTSRLVSALQRLFDEEGLPLFIMNRSTLFRILPTRPFPMLELFYYSLLTKGIYVWENRVCYLSTAHTDEDCARVLQGAKEAVQELIAAGVWPGRGQHSERDGDEGQAIKQLQESQNNEIRTVATTEAQREFWTSSNLSQNGPGSHHLAHVFRFRGKLNADAMERALQTVASRHDSMRACFSSDGAQLRIFGSVPVNLPLTDLADLAPEVREVELEKHIREAAGQPFDLERPPLFRARLARLAEDDHYLLLTISHVLADGWSIAVILKELAEVYSAERKGCASRLRPPRQFGEFADWLANQQKESSARDEKFWRASFQEKVPPLGLCSARQRRLTSAHVGASHAIYAGADLRQALASFSARHGSTLFSTLLAALSCLLTRITGQSDTLIAIASAGQAPAGMPHLVGYCLNSLFHRTRITSDLTVSEHVTATAALLMEEQEHRNYAANRLLKEYNGSPSEPRLPVDVVFNVDRDLSQDIIFHGLKMEFVNRPVDSVIFPFGLMATDSGADLELRFDYAKDFFDESAVHNIASCYRRLLEEMVAHPERPLFQLALLGPEERHRALIDWNLTGREFPQSASIPQLFEQQAERTPGQVAVSFADMQLTYAQLNCRANQLAHHLCELGAEPRQVVAVWLDRSPDMVACMLAILKTGAAYLPVDEECPPEQLAWMLKQCGVKILITETKWQERSIPGWAGERVCLEKHAKLIATASPRNLIIKPDARDLAYVIYTSGSRGEPKGVMIPHQGVVRLVRNTDYVSLGGGDVVAQASNSAFDAATFEIWGSLLNGARLVILDREQLLDPENIERQIVAHGINTMFLTTALMNQIVAANPDAFAGLKQLMFGGETPNCQRVRELLQGGQPRRLVHMYGLTENTTFSSWHHVQRADDDQAIPIGVPIANSRLYVLNEEMEPAPVGVIGELYIGGAGLARGYLNHADWTAESFVPDPFASEPGLTLYRTGDLVRYRVSGAIEFVGHINKVKFRSFRIELARIEAALHANSGVRDAIVVVKRGPGNDDNDQHLVAYVVSAHKTDCSIVELRKHLKQRIPEDMVPSAFVFLEALPLGPNGKVNHAALPEPQWQPDAPEIYVPPLSHAEERLCKIWAGVLGVARVGVNDNFFDLGGDSILAIQVIARAKKAGFHFTQLQLFEHPTIAELAQLPGMDTGILREQSLAGGRTELTPIQRWFFEQDLAEPYHFNQSALFELSVPWEPAKVERVVAALVKQHDALRMRYEQGPSGWRQMRQVAGSAVPFVRIDLSGLAPAEQIIAVETKAEELQRSLDLAQGQLIRVALFEAGEGRKGRLLIVIHHLAVDFVSWGILLEEMTLAYQQLENGQEIRLPEKSDSFQLWGQRLLEHANSAKVREELQYWSSAQRAFAVPLPVDFPNGNNTMNLAEQVSVTLSSEQTEKLARYGARQHHALVHEMILSALVQAIAKWSGTSQALIDIESNGRMLRMPGVDVSRTVGWFTCIYPVLLQAATRAGEKECLKQVQRELRQVPDGGVGYGLLRYLNSEPAIREQLACLPEAQVCFNYFGKFDRIFEHTSAFRPAPESKGHSESPHAQRKYLLEVEGLINSGCLEVRFRYSKALHRKTTMMDVAQFFRSALCAYLPDLDGRSNPSYATEDFPLADLSQQDLEHLVGELSEAEV